MNLETHGTQAYFFPLYFVPKKYSEMTQVIILRSPKDEILPFFFCRETSTYIRHYKLKFSHKIVTQIEVTNSNARIMEIEVTNSNARIMAIVRDKDQKRNLAFVLFLISSENVLLTNMIKERCQGDQKVIYY